MQVIPNSEASIVLLLFKKKITRWSSWLGLKSVLKKKKSQTIARGKERLLVIGLSKRPCI